MVAMVGGRTRRQGWLQQQGWLHQHLERPRRSGLGSGRERCISPAGKCDSRGFSFKKSSSAQVVKPFSRLCPAALLLYLLYLSL